MLVTAQPRGVLSAEAMKGRDGWDAALNLPLPPRPEFYLLDEARQHVVAYLDWVTHDLARGPSPDELRREIERAAERLLEISLALRALLDRGDCDDG
ncbi:MAG TPA: hypothetical protein VL985_16800 [Stellaceae bacterium]|nr:hypothetical protein [Stellaceae bacterium]